MGTEVSPYQTGMRPKRFSGMCRFRSRVYSSGVYCSKKKYESLCLRPRPRLLLLLLLLARTHKNDLCDRHRRKQKLLNSEVQVVGAHLARMEL
ncbi:hypothetical protein F2P81_021500 [Scophthalmus maximus]|uniref:Uncharacterized protein n=1 Tax=Scophthalmus maximus TaxID=52904 RepID=A0A6A4RXD5_SCOMX|nr:hypothetical protein F2P81_021500 [Scophthalmus maximus]